MRVATVVLLVQSPMNKFKVWWIKQHDYINSGDGMSLKQEESWFGTLLKPGDDGHLSDDCLTKTSGWEEEEKILLNRGASERRDIDQPTPPLPCVCCQLEQKLYTQNIGRWQRRGNLHAKQLCQKRIEWSDEGRREEWTRAYYRGRTTPTPWLKKVIFQSIESVTAKHHGSSLIWILTLNIWDLFHL